MTPITRKHGVLQMNRKGLWKIYPRQPEEQKKPKEKKCWECGSLPHRVTGPQCKKCGLVYEEERIGIEIPGIRSSAGIFEENF